MKTPILVAIALMSGTMAWADDAGDLAAIRALYAKIDQGKPVKIETVSFADESDPLEGTLVRRSYEGGLSAIKLSYVAGDHGGTDQSYYFKDGELFFIYTQDTTWHFAPGSTDEKPKTVDTLIESRYYVRDGKVIQALQRSATTNEDKKLEELIAKVENKKLSGDPRGAKLIKRAAGVAKIKTGEEALKFFASEEE